MMRPTRWYVLLAAGLLAGSAAFAITRSSYDEIPRPGTFSLLWLAILAIAEFYVALLTRARLAGRAGTKAIDPLVVARYVALSKASSVVGCLSAGGYAGYLIWVARLDSPTASSDTTSAAVGVGCGLLLVAAALFLEYVCRVPKGDDDDEGLKVGR
jgi:hypothetical protein